MDDKHKDNSIGIKLRELRIDHGYTQADIAAALGITQQTYSQYETGRRTPNAVALYRIASYYGISVDDLLRLIVELDDSIYFDAPGLSPDGMGFVDYMDFMEQEKLKGFSQKEKELLYYFRKLGLDDQDEVVKYAVFRLQQQNSR